MLRQIAKIILAPFFFIAVISGALLVVFVLGAISIGGWTEAALMRFGYRHRPMMLPLVVGVVVFLGGVLVGAGALGSRLLGWPGIIAGPALTILLISLVDRW